MVGISRADRKRYLNELCELLPGINQFRADLDKYGNLYIVCSWKDFYEWGNFLTTFPQPFWDLRLREPEDPRQHHCQFEDKRLKPHMTHQRSQTALSSFAE